MPESAAVVSNEICDRSIRTHDSVVEYLRRATQERFSPFLSRVWLMHDLPSETNAIYHAAHVLGIGHEFQLDVRLFMTISAPQPERAA
jgi:hypothetical protein